MIMTGATRRASQDGLVRADQCSGTTSARPIDETRTDAVIMLTRLGGQAMALNPDLIEKAEATPDTVITMVDGHKLVVVESVAEVVSLIRLWRASVAAEAFALSDTSPPAAAGGPGEGPQGDTGEHVAASGGRPSLAQVLRLPARPE
jgi:flagellar protein FlbD